MSERRDWRLLVVEKLIRCPREGNVYVDLDACKDCEFHMQIIDSCDLSYQEVICKYRGERR